MIWHALTRVGPADNYEPVLNPAEPRIHVAFERSGDPWRISNNVLAYILERAGASPASTAVDLLYLAMAVYAADLRIPRRLSTDRWSRDIVLHVPVEDVTLWATHAAHIEHTLCFLTGDRWTLRFRDRESTERDASHCTVDNVQAVCLFSGGLDSLVGAIDMLAEGKRVALVGHHGSGVTNPIQRRVFEAVEAKYGTAAIPFMFHAQPPKGDVKDGEPTMRSRSFLFFAMGIAVGSALGGTVPLVVAENGLISLNVPLTFARTGSRSTRTTHPHYMALFTELLKRLDLLDEVQMPYRFKTKGEMLSECKDQASLVTAAKLTMSCSHPEVGRYRGLAPNNHCGYCVPCIIRKAGMKASGLADAPYNTVIETNPPAHTTEAGRDYRAFRMALERVRDMSESHAAFRVLASGPLPAEDIRQYAGVYLRGMAEVRSLIAAD